MIIFAHWDFSSSGTHQDAQFVSLSRRVNNVKTEIICQVTLEKILISPRWLAYFLWRLRKEMTGIIFCVLLSGPGSVFHPNGDTRQQGAERGAGPGHS